MSRAVARLFCFGMGYSARTFAVAARERGWCVAGTTRNEQKRTALAAEGFEAFLFDRDCPLPTGALDDTTHILVSAPPDGVDRPTGDPVLDHHADAVRSLSGLEWVGYLSTTGVYGDRGGGWVDETSALVPTSERGRRRVAAERAWLALHESDGVPVHVFRLSGIYGPGRSVIDQLRSGRARRIDKPGQVFNRIHVADISAALMASIDRPDPGAAYNLADDDPTPSRIVVEHAAALLGREPPPLVPFDEADLSAMARSFYADNKRVDNRRIKQQLGVTLRYPSYREGLAAQIADDR